MLENPKGFLLSVFSALLDFFPKIKKNFFFNFFMFCDRMDVEKPQRVPPFNFSALRLFFRKIVSPKGPPSIFLWFCDRMDVKKSPRVPLSVFRHCETCFENVFSPKGPFNCDKNVDNFRSAPLLARHSAHFFGFSIFEYCKLTLGSPFAIFEP